MTVHEALYSRDDFDRYRENLADWRAKRIDDQKFITERLRLGIYAQRQEELCMVRVKLPGGRLNPHALIGLAESVNHYSGRDIVHLTTRQDIQFHDVALEQTPNLLEHLALFGIGSRAAGGNTVRNITACPLAGVCPAEHVDVTTHVQRVSRHFARHPLTQSLPRKFKIGVSGCASDCALGAVNDLAVTAAPHDGKPGFRVLVGGGLGAAPRRAIVLEEFIPETDLLPVIEAVLAVHDRHSDRKRKTRSRIKFLVERFGAEGFRERYRAELVRTRAAHDPTGAPRGTWREPQPGTTPPAVGGAPRQPLAQHQTGLVAVPVSVPHGDLSAAQLRGLARILSRLDLDDLRATQDQNLLVLGVPEARVDTLLTALAEIDLGLPTVGDRVIACPGTATCTLGITASASVAAELDGGSSDLGIRVNGCQNSCAASDIADIGCYGLGRRHHGRLVPSYGLQLGGNGQGSGTLGLDGPVVPAARLPQTVARIEAAFRDSRSGDETFAAWTRHRGTAWFDDLLADLTHVTEFELSSLTRDHGDNAVFSVQSVGLGECAGVGTDPVEKGFLDADYERRIRDALAAKGKVEDALAALGNALLAAANGLLAAGGGGHVAQLADLPELFVTSVESAESSGVGLVALLDDLAAQKATRDELAFPDLARRADAWVDAAHASVSRIQRPLPVGPLGIPPAVAAAG